MKISRDELERRLSSTRNLATRAREFKAPIIQHTNSGPISIISGTPDLGLEATKSPQSPQSSQSPQNKANQANGQQSKTSKVEHRNSKPPRNKSCNVPEPVRDVIGAIGELAPYKTVAREFNVSELVVSQAVTGRVGGRPATAERLHKIQERRYNIEDIALNKLMASLNLLSEDTLSEASVSDLARVSTSMAKVSQMMRDQTQIGSQTNIVVYAPDRRAEDKYKVIDV